MGVHGVPRSIVYENHSTLSVNNDNLAVCLTPSACDGCLIVRKLGAGRDDYLKGAGGSLSEWDSLEDEKAWRDL